MIKTVIAAMAASVIATATPALAEGKANAEPNVPTSAPAPATPIEKAANPNQRYCVVETVTGSRIPNRICRTREVWLLDGFDPLAR